MSATSDDVILRVYVCWWCFFSLLLCFSLSAPQITSSWCWL